MSCDPQNPHPPYALATHLVVVAPKDHPAVVEDCLLYKYLALSGQTHLDLHDFVTIRALAFGFAFSVVAREPLAAEGASTRRECILAIGPRLVREAQTLAQRELIRCAVRG